MEKQELFDLMNNNVGFHLATVDGDKPRVRGMMLYKADADGIVFHTGTFKDLYKQVVANPNAELCFFDSERNIQVRVSGVLDMVDDNGLKDEISNHPSRVFLQPWKNSVTPEDFYDSFIVFRMRNGRAVVWTMETNLAPKQVIEL